MSTCKQCGLVVSWKKNEGRWQCHNPDGSIHWDRCSEERTKKALAQGTMFEEKFGRGVIHEQKQIYMAKWKATIKAKDKTLPVCDCKSPPWEDCRHTR